MRIVALVIGAGMDYWPLSQQIVKMSGVISGPEHTARFPSNPMFLGTPYFTSREDVSDWSLSGDSVFEHPWSDVSCLSLPDTPTPSSLEKL